MNTTETVVLMFLLFVLFMALLIALLPADKGERIIKLIRVTFSLLPMSAVAKAFSKKKG
jgi:hypothetical protein